MDVKTALPWPVQSPLQARSRISGSTVVILVAIAFSWVLCTQILDVRVQLRPWHTKSLPKKYSCKPFLPSNLLQLYPPSSDEPAFTLPKLRLESQIAMRAALPDMDSVTIGIVNTNGLIWSKSFGRARANGTEFFPPNEHTIYRIASISKLFATMQGFIMRDKGVIGWDDPVQKHLTNFTYNPQSWIDYLKHGHENVTSSEVAPDTITLRQLASQMSGIGRDWPPINFDWWPIPPRKREERLYLPTLEEQLASIAKLPLTAPPYTIPAYSNTGFSILGASLVAAGNETNYPTLLERDIFTPLGMNGSSFAASEHNRAHLAIPRNGAEIDLVAPDSFNAAGGQFSSLTDLSKVVQSILTANRHKSLLSATTKREWLRPLYSFPDTYSETGMPWEIVKQPDSHGRKLRYYSKGGNLQYSHSELVINPDLQYGAIVLMTGVNPDAAFFSNMAIAAFQPVLERMLENAVQQRYAGSWKGHGKDVINVELKDGSLWITKWVANGIDFLNLYESGLEDRVALWSTGRLDEFRAAIGRPSLDAGCIPSWVLFDPMQSHHAPIDLIYFEEIDDRRVLQFPSANVTMYR